MVNRPLNTLFSPTFLVIHSTVAFGGGIILARSDFASSPPLLITTFGLGTAGLLLLALTNKRPHALVVLFFLLAGVCHGSQALAPPRTEHHIANLIPEQREVALIGVVDQAIEYGIEKTTLVMESQGIFIPSSTPLPLLPADHSIPPFQKATGRVKLSMRGMPAESFLPGDRILTRAKISPPQGFINPGGFNLSRFLASQDILISGWISSPQSLIRLEPPPDHQNLLRHRAERYRARLINFMRLHLPEKQSALYRALITGDRAGLSPATVELFRSLGIVPLLAISGLHMALLAGAIMALSFWLLQRSETILLHGSARKISACAAIIPLFLYCLIAGFQTPALRALIMTLIFFSALLSDRPWHGPTNVSLAALLILLISPMAITTVSFQLSFAAVIGIILILPLLRPFFTDSAHQNPKSKIIRYLSGSIAVSLAASLATLPLLLYHFNRFALSSSLATLITEPFLCIWALGWGLPASLLSPFFPDLALFLFKTGGWGLDAALFLAEKLQPMAKSIWLPTPSLPQVIFFYTCLFLFIKT
ncbi:MAG: ComEC/Rec2 family competence protein, partial [Deltaproteobacteria bacterium]|nr:ComEC/Rec2 family competence protein [Deltaproteobacteria bacterium]